MSTTPPQADGPAGASQQLSFRRMWPVYLAALLFLCLRNPHELIHGAVVGEEGTVYLRFAWETPVLHALRAQHQGYYSLFSNICGILAARVLPLEQVAHFFVLAQIACQMLLVYAIVQCERFVSLRQKVLAVAVALLVPPTVAVMMSTVNAQFFLAITTAVILISDATRLKVFRILAVAFAGVNGLVSCVLLPFFCYKAWKERTAARAEQAVVLLGATAFQSIQILKHAGGTVGQLSALDYYFGTFLANGPLSEFFTPWSVQQVCRIAGSPKISSFSGLWWGTVEFGSVLYLFVVFLLFWKSSRFTLLLAGAGLLNLLVGLSRGSAVNYLLMCGASGHYFFVFNSLIGLGLVLATWEAPRAYARVAGCLVVLSLISGVWALFQFDRAPRGPTWASEVALWRSDPSHRLVTFYNYWAGLRLAPQRGDRDLPDSIYDSTNPDWPNR